MSSGGPSTSTVTRRRCRSRARPAQAPPSRSECRPHMEPVPPAGAGAARGPQVPRAPAPGGWAPPPPCLERIPVRRRDEIIIVPVGHIASIVADGELLYLSTLKNERHAITYRLKDLEARLDPARFIRLGRGTLANIDLITKVNVMPGGTHVALLSNGQKLQVSRLQSRIIRERFLRL